MRVSDQASLVDRFRHLSQKTGKPLSSRKSLGTVFKIYRAKNLYELEWLDGALKDLVFLARRMSNLPYSRPIKDEYDSKSAIYIGSATYPLLVGDEHFFIEEWLSVRLVPGNGNPRGTGELEIYTCRGENVENIVRKRFFQNNDNFLNYVFASNRMCGCKPYFKNKADERRLTGDFLSNKIKHTAILYALINKHFVQDYLSSLNSRYITGVIIDQLVDRALTTEIGSDRYGTHFTYAHELLGVPASEVKLNRHINNNYAYRYPTYFLDVRQLLAWLGDLVKKGMLTQDSVRHYLKTDVTFGEMNVQSHLHLYHLRNLYKIFLEEGKIFGSNLTGAELRSLADTEIEDGPKLRITPINDLANSIEVFLNAAEIR